MALTSAQLTSAITASQIQFALSNIANSSLLPTVGATPLAVGIPMMIDSEFMFCISQPVAGTVVVRGRGSDSSAASAHDTLANVYFSSNPADFPAPQATTSSTITPWETVIYSLGQDQTIPLFGTNATYNINKASAAALTLTAPNLTDNGIVLVLTSNTAFAHVITATSLLNDGASGAPHTTATFAAQKGATLVLAIENGFYNVRSANNVTIT